MVRARAVMLRVGASVRSYCRSFSLDRKPILNETRDKNSSINNVIRESLSCALCAIQYSRGRYTWSGGMRSSNCIFSAINHIAGEIIKFNARQYRAERSGVKRASYPSDIVFCAKKNGARTRFNVFFLMRGFSITRRLPDGTFYEAHYAT